MKIETKNETITYERITKRFELLVDDEIKIIVSKWWSDDEYGGDYECDYEIDDEDKAKDAFEKKYGKEDWEDEWYELKDYIEDELE